MTAEFRVHSSLSWPEEGDQDGKKRFIFWGIAKGELVGKDDLGAGGTTAVSDPRMPVTRRRAGVKEADFSL